MTKISDLTALAGSAVDDANDLLPVVDMSEAGTARNKKITFDETRIALGLSTADSPQFTALNLGHASDTTITRVSAGVAAIEGVNIVTTAGGVTFAADIIVPDEAYDATNWDGNLEVPTKNAVRDKIESLSAGGIAVEDEGVSEGTGLTTLNFTGAGVSVTVVGSEAEVIIPGGGGGIDVEDEGVAEATGATTLNFVGAGVTAADMGGGVVDVTISGGGGGVDVEDEGVAEATGATILNFTGAGVTATDVGGGQVDIDVPGGGSAAWTLAGGAYAAAGVWDQAVDGSVATVEFNNLGSYNEVMLLARNVTKAVSGDTLVRGSTNNGSSFHGTSGDYVFISTAGVETNSADFGAIHNTANGAARSGVFIVRNLGGDGAPPIGFNQTGDTNHRYFVLNSSKINALQVRGSAGGNLTGGKIFCLAR